MRTKSMYVVLSVVLVLGALLAGCGTKSGNGGEQAFRMNLHSEPPTLDPGQSQDNISSTVLTALYEGLVQLDADNKPQPGMAEKWDISDDKTKYTFHLRKDAKWSNGDPVTAHDFEFAWKRVLDPKAEPAPPYAYQLYYLKNAQNYNVIEDNPNHISDPNQVGVKATDDYTLEVTLESPTPYFLGLTSFMTYYPVHTKTVQSNPAWASEANSIITNGPFKISQWKHNDSIELVPNENYYDKGNIHLTKVNLTMVNNASTELSMYETNQLDYTGKPTGEIPADQLPKLKESKKDEMEIKGIASTYYYVFNTTAAPFDNVKIRKAFAMAIDRQEIVDKVTLAGELPAYGFVSPGISGADKEYRQEYKDDFFKEDIEEAKKLLAEGMQEKGYAKLPEITLIHNEGAGHKKVAEAIADMWNKKLGVSVKTEVQEWGVFLKNRTNLNYQIARAGWGADYNDPMTYMDLWTSTSGNNDSGWKNKEYDGLVKEATTSFDQKKRMESMSKAEKLLMDDMVILPIYYYSNVRLLKPGFQDIFIDYKGDINFNRGYIK